MKRHLRLLAVLTAFALVMAACGGDDDGTATTIGDNGGETTTPPAEGFACELDEVDGDLNFYNWSEYIDPDLLTAFEDQYDVIVTETFYDSNEALFAALQAGAVYDLIVPSDYMVAIMIEEQILAPLDKDAIPNLVNLDPQFVDLPFDPTTEFSVAYQWGTTGLGVNVSVVGEDYEPSWALVFDSDLTAGLAGGVSLLNDPRETMGAALKYLGYSLNDTDIDHLQEAADVIIEARDAITTYDSDQFADLLVNGEVAVSHGYSGDHFSAFDGADDPDNWEYVIPEEGGTIWVDNIAVPAAAEHPCTAHTFINFILDAENGAALTNWVYYASPNAAAEEFIDPEILEDETIYPSDELRQRLEFIVDTGDYEINFNDYFALAKTG